MVKAHDFALLTTTVASRSEAESLARTLVETRLAACVQIMTIDSVYAWEGTTEQAAEQLLIMKIRLADFAEAETMIRGRHDYDVPEIVAIPLIAGSRDYLSWLFASTER